jgi:hypothetical protein
VLTEEHLAELRAEIEAFDIESIDPSLRAIVAIYMPDLLPRMPPNVEQIKRRE